MIPGIDSVQNVEIRTALKAIDREITDQKQKLGRISVNNVRVDGDVQVFVSTAVPTATSESAFWWRPATGTFGRRFYVWNATAMDWLHLVEAP